MKAKEFWNYFEDNEAIIREEFDEMCYPYLPELDALDMALKDYSWGLGWVLSYDKKQKKHKLVITADSNPDYFLAAITLVEQAPTMLRWNIIALIPPVSYSKKEFMIAEWVLDGTPIKFVNLKGTLSHMMSDGTYGITFVLSFIFRDKNIDQIREDLCVLLEFYFGERRFGLTIVFVGIEFEQEEDFEYTTLDKLDRAMLEYDRYCAFLNAHKNDVQQFPQ